MSDFTHKREQRLKKLHELANLLLSAGNARSFILENKDFIDRVDPADFIFLFDELIAHGHPPETLRPLSNKILNIFHRSINSHERPEAAPGSLIRIMEENNREMEVLLDRIRPVFKSYIRDPLSEPIRQELTGLFKHLEEFGSYYTIKENVLFPWLEQQLPEHRCLQLMWSFHDEIRQNIRSILQLLEMDGDTSSEINPLVGDVFFHMLTIKFREEQILFPFILSELGDEGLEAIKPQALELGFPYWQPETEVGPGHKKPSTGQSTDRPAEYQLIDLQTGNLDPEQIRLIFGHLPVDITFVDEDNRVRFFSATPDRIFPRTLAIIGRDVHNCHPPESVHVVEEIIRAFRKGEKDEASFWIKVKEQYVLIRYFAVRNENGVYKGVIEVSQEISGIRQLKGERRLLDW